MPYGYGLNYRFYSGPNITGVSIQYLWYNVLPMDLVRTPSASILTCDTGYVEPATMDLPVTEWKERSRVISRGFVRFPQCAAPPHCPPTAPKQGGACLIVSNPCLIVCQSFQPNCV